MAREAEKTPEEKSKTENLTGEESKAASVASATESSAKAPPSEAAKPSAVVKKKFDVKKTVNKQIVRFTNKFQRSANDEAVRQLNSGPSDKVPLRVFANAVGQLLYRVGEQTIYAFVVAARVLRAAGQLFAAAVLALFHVVGSALFAFFIGVWHDITEPIVHFFRALVNIRAAVRAAREEGSVKGVRTAYVKRGLKVYRRIILSGLLYFLPIGAIGILVLVTTITLSTPYSLAVTYNDEMIGYIQNQGVWETAQKQVRDRIKAADNGQAFDAYPSFNLRQVDLAARRTAEDLANVIITKSSDQIQQAVGVYVDDVLICVGDDAKGMQKMMESAIASAQSEADPTARTAFVKNLTTVPGIYYTSSIVPLDSVRTQLNAMGALQVKTIITSTYQEPLPFETTEFESADYYTGSTRVTQKGIDGIKEVTADIAYIDGVEISRTVLSEAVVQDAMPKMVAVGTRALPAAIAGSSGQVGSGSLSFPVPGYTYITTRYGQGGHRGTDICAPYGTPVYACDGGTVVEAGSHFSWGLYVKIDHGNGMQTLYAHNSTLLVSAGQGVSRGQAIGLVGATGTASGNHCHLELYINGSLANPDNYVSP